MSDEPALRFVVQEHYASRHHYDLRLERDGVLWSWAVPKGLPEDPQHNRLAVRVGDHALSHLDFEDTSPVPGRQGAVRVRIWDSGTYRTERFSDRKWVFTLSGRRGDATYALFQTGGKNWMIHLMADGPGNR